MFSPACFAPSSVCHHLARCPSRVLHAHNFRSTAFLVSFHHRGSHLLLISRPRSPCLAKRASLPAPASCSNLRYGNKRLASPIPSPRGYVSLFKLLKWQPLRGIHENAIGRGIWLSLFLRGAIFKSSALHLSCVRLRNYNSYHFLPTQREFECSARHLATLISVRVQN